MRKEDNRAVNILDKQNFRGANCRPLTLAGLLVQSLVPLGLQRDQGEVDPLPLQQLVVFALLHHAAVLEPHDHISVLYGGQPVSDGDGGAAHAYL